MRNLNSRSLYATILLACCLTAAHGQGTITTIAGTGAGGFSGDGGPATLACFSSPQGVATDAAGNIYVADRNNHRVRMISAATGNISTVVGTGVMGYAGMGGLATAAQMEYPNAICFDRYGNYYISDNYADAAYRVDGATGMINNICGHGAQGSSGDGGPGSLARMAIPFGIAVDPAGNQYIADYGNNELRKVNAITGIVTTIAGSIPALGSFSQINGVCTDNNGNVYVSDAGSHHCVKRIDYTGAITTIAGNGTAGYTGDGGPALSAEMRGPGCLFINSSFHLFICDADANVVRVVDLGTGIIHTLAGTGIAGFSGDGGSPALAQLQGPTGVWESASGDIYIADASNNRIRKIVGSGYKTTGTNAVSENNVSVFPNPSNGTFTIQTNSIPDNGSFEVYNLTGEKVFAGTISQQQTVVTIEQPAGVYTILLRSASGMSSHKVTISK